MKTKILLLLILSIGFSSCIKDFYGHPNDKDLVLTEKNYVYSDDIKLKFLDMRVTQLDAEIDELKVLIGLGKATDIQKERFDQATIEKDSALAEHKLISEYRDIVFRRGPIPPPPCPSPRNCDEFWIDFKYVTVPPIYENFQLVIYGKDKNVIAQTEGKPETLGGLDGLLNYVVLTFNDTDYKGPIFVEALGEAKDVKFEPFSIVSNIK